jgi:hypothetical protein
LNVEKAKGRIPGFAVAVTAPTFPDFLLPSTFPDLPFQAGEQNKEEIAEAATGEI